MSETAMMMLRWPRDDKSQFARGYTYGYLAAARAMLPEWEFQYLTVIAKHRMKGESV